MSRARRATVRRLRHVARPLAPVVRRRATPVPYARDEIFARWGGLCCYCDAPASQLDHVQPISRGGLDVESNVVPVCAADNLAKSDKSLAEWAQEVLSLPT